MELVAEVLVGLATDTPDYLSRRGDALNVNTSGLLDLAEFERMLEELEEVGAR